MFCMLASAHEHLEVAFVHIHKRSKVLRGFVSTLSRALRSGERFLFYIHACLEVVGTFTSAHQLFF